EVTENFREFRATARAATLHGSRSDAEHLGGLVDRVSLDVEEHDRCALVVRQLVQCPVDDQTGFTFVDGVARGRGLSWSLLRQRYRRPGLFTAHPIQTRVDND